MPRHSIVRFDSDIVQILTFKQRRSAVELTTTIPIDDFAAFLSEDRSIDYQIIIDAPNANYETITIPPVEPKLVSRIAAIEFHRLYPESPPSTAYYRPIDEVVQEGKILKRVAICMVPNDYLASILEPFIRFNKPVSLISTLPAVLANLVGRDPETSGQTLLCVYDCGDKKCIFLLEKGCITMVRYVPSQGTGWSELDLHNINMTLDYCYQSLRVNPAKTIALNSGTEPPKPLSPFTSAMDLSAYQELLQEYLPHLAVMTCTDKAGEDLRPASYLMSHAHQKILRKGIRVFCVGSLVAALLAFSSLFSILSLQSELDAARQLERTLPDLLSSYHAVQQERSAVEPLVTAMNTLQTTPTLPEALGRLPECGPGITARINSMMAGKTGDTISLRFTGIITEKSFAAAQNSFEATLACFAQLQGFTTSSKQFEQKTQTFSIELKNKP